VSPKVQSFGRRTSTILSSKTGKRKKIWLLFSPWVSQIVITSPWYCDTLILYILETIRYIIGGLRGARRTSWFYYFVDLLYVYLKIKIAIYRISKQPACIAIGLFTIFQLRGYHLLALAFIFCAHFILYTTNIKILKHINYYYFYALLRKRNAIFADVCCILL